MYKNIEVIDCHIHNSYNLNIDFLESFLKDTYIDKVNLLACMSTKCLSLAPKALRMKAKYPDKFTVFVCPDISGYYLNKDNLGEYQKEYIDKLLKAGADGIKLLEGKPQMRKMFPIPDFDDIVWEPFWEYLESNHVPIIFHVNDPEEFWNKSIAPDFAIREGWLYDESFINNEAQYIQVLNVLEKHPELRICFPHFFFMSRHLDRLSNILDTYKNVKVDLTPGIEMYENFSNNYDASLEFFNKYHDRIMFGTDIGGRCVLGKGENRPFDVIENLRRPEIVLDFLSSDETLNISSDGHYIIDRPTFKMRGLNLKDEILEEILNLNFNNFIMMKNRVDLSLVEKEELYEKERYSILKKKGLI